MDNNIPDLGRRWPFVRTVNFLKEKGFFGRWIVQQSERLAFSKPFYFKNMGSNFYFSLLKLADNTGETGPFFIYSHSQIS